MDIAQISISLLYRPKWRKDEAAQVAAGIDGTVRMREARLFGGAGDCEFKVAKVGKPRVNYDRVLALAGSPMLDSIVAEYAEHGVEVEVVSVNKPPAAEAPASKGAPDRPKYKTMRKDLLREAALKHYGENLPLEMKVKELRAWLEAQPWPPPVPPREAEV